MMEMNNQKNILVIGDLTTAHNYGAIATSETLKKIFFANYGPKVKYIDHRSFVRSTPRNGWDSSPSMKNRTIYEKIYDIIKPYDSHNFILNTGLKLLGETTTSRKDIPYLYRDYKKYLEKMLDGNVLQYEYDLLEWADIIYINGEGNVVNGTDKYGVYRIGALYILFLAYVAKKHFNKYCAIINHTVDPNNEDAEEIIKNVYPLLDYIAVREPYSIKTLHKMGIKNVELVPDALFTFVPDTDKNSWKPSDILNKEIDFTRPYICIGDSSGIKSRTNEVKWDVYDIYSKLIKQLRTITPQIVFVDGFNGGHESINRIVKENKIGRINLENCNYKELYHVLSNAEIFISGRWHASILSLLAGTPILLWGADSHKTRGLYPLIDYPYRFFQIDTLPLHIADITKETKKILEDKKSIKSKMSKKVSELRIDAENNTIPSHLP